MEIKICGITTIEDAINACTCGADALGFIFYKKSPRYVSPETAKHIIESLSLDTAVVGVFVNHHIKEIKDICAFCRLDMIQLHGDESPEYCRQFTDSLLIKALSPRMEENIGIVKDFPVKSILLDARDAGQYGGTGKKSNWQLAARIKETHSLILAGGLNHENIMEAIETVAPHAVDINSGVEFSPGKKDPEKVKTIINLIHSVKRKSAGKIFSKLL